MTKASTSATTGNSSYQYMHSYTYSDGKTIGPIAVLKVDDDNPFPSTQNLNAVQIVELGEVVIILLANIAINLTNLLNVGAVGSTADPAGGEKSDESESSDKATIIDALKSIEQKTADLRELVALGKSVVEKVEAEAESGVGSFIKDKIEDIGEEIGDQIEKIEKFGGKLVGKFSSKLGSSDDSNASSSSSSSSTSSETSTSTESSDDSDEDSSGLSCVLTFLLEDIVKFLVDEAIKGILTDAGLYGEATSIRQYADQFQTIVVPNVASTTNNDDAFAAQTVSGPNPLVIERVIDALPANFGVEDAAYKKVMGADDSIEQAIKDKRLYLTDYKALSVMKPGTFPQQKYTSAPLALFAVAKGDSCGSLKSVALQVGQQPAANNPVLYPFHGDSWDLGKVHVKAADGNFHELISHLGLTHLLVEPFAVSTHAKLGVNHPVFELLLPHIQGTLFINNAAITSLVAPEGIVDRLLGGTIETDWQVTINAVGSVNFNERMLPNQLASRNVADPALPLSYPYRDDALDVWAAIKQWANAYLSIFYKGDAQVAADKALQSWVLDLTSDTGGCISGLGEDQGGQLGIYTLDYLVDVVTMVIFTASAQHATVNFPQLTTMSYAPAMPLATYAPPPQSAAGTPSQSMLSTLPPLEQALVQQLLGQGLGGVYFTRLGDYNRHQQGNYFSNTDVQGALEVFRDNLDAVETRIGARNLKRPYYEHLLPSRIPQSINI